MIKLYFIKLILAASSLKGLEESGEDKIDPFL